MNRWGRRNVYSSVPTNKCRRKDLENHHLTTTVVIIVLGKNYKNTSCNRSKFGEK